MSIKLMIADDHILCREGIKQLLEYDSPNLGMLILDVKGNFYKQVLEYTKLYNRLSDIIVIELNSNVRYNPLDKPNLNASVLANRFCE